jgi:hypothetical protein
VIALASAAAMPPAYAGTASHESSMRLDRGPLVETSVLRTSSRVRFRRTRRSVSPCGNVLGDYALRPSTRVKWSWERTFYKALPAPAPVPEPPPVPEPTPPDEPDPPPPEESTQQPVPRGVVRCVETASATVAPAPGGRLQVLRLAGGRITYKGRAKVGGSASRTRTATVTTRCDDGSTQQSTKRISDMFFQTKPNARAASLRLLTGTFREPLGFSSDTYEWRLRAAR